MIVCLRTVVVPSEERASYLEWIADGRAVREAHGILAEWVLEPTDGDGETVVVTIWPQPRGVRRLDRHARTRRAHRVRRPPRGRVPAHHPLRRRRWLPQPAGSPRPSTSRRSSHEMDHPRPPQDRPHRLSVVDPSSSSIPTAEILYVPTDQVLAVAEREQAPRLRRRRCRIRPPRRQMHVRGAHRRLRPRRRSGARAPGADRARRRHRQRDRHRSGRPRAAGHRPRRSRRRSRRPSAAGTSSVRLRRAVRMVRTASRQRASA